MWLIISRFSLLTERHFPFTNLKAAIPNLRKPWYMRVANHRTFFLNENWATLFVHLPDWDKSTKKHWNILCEHRTPEFSDLGSEHILYLLSSNHSMITLTRFFWSYDHAIVSRKSFSTVGLTESRISRWPSSFVAGAGTEEMLAPISLRQRTESLQPLTSF